MIFISKLVRINGIRPFYVFFLISIISTKLFDYALSQFDKNRISSSPQNALISKFGLLQVSWEPNVYARYLTNNQVHRSAPTCLSINTGVLWWSNNGFRAQYVLIIHCKLGDCVHRNKFYFEFEFYAEICFIRGVVCCQEVEFATTFWLSRTCLTRSAIFSLSTTIYRTHFKVQMKWE